MSNSFEGLRVLIIDDSNTVRLTTESILKKEGCIVGSVENGFEALAHIAEFNPDLILLDIMMPRLDGYQTCAVIKHNEQFQNKPIIFLSSMDGLFDKVKGRMAGAEAYITKPFSREILLDAISTQLSNS